MNTATYTVWCGDGNSFPEMLLDQITEDVANRLAMAYMELHPTESAWVESSEGVG